MTLFQLIMLGASAFFAYKIYEHIQTLKDPQDNGHLGAQDERNAEAFSPFDASSLVEKADEAMDKGDLQKALAIYSEANIKEPKNSETLFKMGYTLAQQNRDDEALEYYKEALELDPNNTYIHQAMASLYRKMGEYASARNHLNKSLEIDATNPITYYNYGNLLVDMKHFDEAKAMYEKAIKLNPDFEEAKEELEKIGSGEII
ncbi:tetratricopeptide repeat protein [Sulfurimonas autotrophica]|uniref:TPR repeat-containing protein n=1 Tax=Sulfurimonas autotrophica (strain ATCC BAA-671 / DSM 16294 / JCM 11897 / OK10) TaxID=563040 RepID=E0UQ66_SULAO|nr:tetratricopeptide repeat protein [Sulfurimonas autotrophica]ADN09809.1 TPR repeat-containing protein [Sulfurimonas autotrophica DSM 16294]